VKVKKGEGTIKGLGERGGEMLDWRQDHSPGKEINRLCQVPCRNPFAGEQVWAIVLQKFERELRGGKKTGTKETPRWYPPKDTAGKNMRGNHRVGNSKELRKGQS